GIAYVYDPKGNFELRCNPSMVDVERLLPMDQQAPVNLHCNTFDEELLKHLVGEHHRRTRSAVAEKILADWDMARSKFVKVFPHEYRRALTELAQSNKSEREAA
ncbi:MAG: hypothetical protein HOK08_03280, partial [Betaproteobacteria bacterium]|nr:hypothetical protein [Betaproteobacteria bacterium]